MATVGSAPNDVSSDEVALAEHGFDRANEVGNDDRAAVIQALKPSRPGGWFGIGLRSIMLGASRSLSAEVSSSLTAAMTRR